MVVLTNVPKELQLDKANISNTEAPSLDLNLLIANDINSVKMSDNRDDFGFDIVKFLL